MENQTEKTQAGPLRSGDLFGGLVLSGCVEHPHRTDLSCCKIRRPDGTALTAAETWAEMQRLSTELGCAVALIRDLAASDVGEFISISLRQRIYELLSLPNDRSETTQPRASGHT